MFPSFGLEGALDVKTRDDYRHNQFLPMETCWTLLISRILTSLIFVELFVRARRISGQVTASFMVNIPIESSLHNFPPVAIHFFQHSCHAIIKLGFYIRSSAHPSLVRVLAPPPFRKFIRRLPFFDANGHRIPRGSPTIFDQPREKPSRSARPRHGNITRSGCGCG